MCNVCDSLFYIFFIFWYYAIVAFSICDAEQQDALFPHMEKLFCDIDKCLI